MRDRRITIINPQTLVLTSGTRERPEWSVAIDSVTKSKIDESQARSEVELNGRTFAALGLSKAFTPNEAAKIAKARYMAEGVPRVSSGAVLIDLHGTSWVLMAGRQYRDRVLVCVPATGRSVGSWTLPRTTRRLIGVYQDTLWVLDAVPGRFPSSVKGYITPKCGNRSL